ncbi:RNA-binding S4 domain-containing protein [Lysobacter korlensis]|uniref:Heat shock protein 15 n=1 Tax=Lysobacter korlensis TaxID=553636 RepID=A0ABV6RYG0_9GAMM
MEAQAKDSQVRVDVWLWAVRIYKTRSLATAACRAGHVRVNGERAKPAQALKVGDEVRVRTDRERILTVAGILRKRAGAPAAAAALIDSSPPIPPREETAAPVLRTRGAGRPTKRERRDLERLRGH